MNEDQAQDSDEDIGGKKFSQKRTNWSVEQRSEVPQVTGQTSQVEGQVQQHGGDLSELPVKESK